MTPAIRSELDELEQFCLWIGLGGIASAIESALRGRAYDLLNAEFAINDIRHVLVWSAPHCSAAFEMMTHMENRLHALRADLKRAA